jgi:hypothetical protein
VLDSNREVRAIDVYGRPIYAPGELEADERRRKAHLKFGLIGACVLVAIFVLSLLFGGK